MGERQDQTHTDEMGAACIGVAAHKWTLHVEHGVASLGTPSCGPDCPVEHGYDLIPEDIYIEDLPVSVGLATECPAYDHDANGFVVHPPKPMRGYESGSHYIAHGSRCDCNWWATAVPLAYRAAPPASSSPAEQEDTDG